MTSSTSRQLVILHFNDVYNIEEGQHEPVGGAARFSTLVKSFKDENPLLLFSGDAFSPSMMGTVTRGTQMVPVLNKLNINTAVYGNHEFDYGLDELNDLVAGTNFPWLMSNVYDQFTNRPLADGLVSRMITWNGIEIGLIGLVEKEWLETLSTLDQNNLNFIDFVKQGKKLADKLRGQGAELIIALTHMRTPNDVILAESVEGIDLILGGHDHDYNVQQVNDKYVVKSGTEFRNLSKIVVTLDGLKPKITVEKRDVTREIPADPEVQEIVDSYKAIVDQELEDVLGTLGCDLDCRFSIVRTQETKLGNLIADVMLSTTQADVSIINSGTFRSDMIHKKGDFKKKDLKLMLPFLDPLIVIEVTGHDLWQALENGVSQYPKHEGRFPSVGGIKFGYDPSAPSGYRVDPLSIKVDNRQLLPKKLYKVCAKSYIAKGKDGYESLTSGKVLVDEELAPVLSCSVANHFSTAQVVKGLKKHKSMHQQSLVSLSKKPGLVRQNTLAEAEKTYADVSPILEGRIYHLSDEQRASIAEHCRIFRECTDEEIRVKSQELRRRPVGDHRNGDYAVQDLFDAIRRNNLEEVKTLSNNNSKNTDFCHGGTTALHVAVEYDSINVARYLLEDLKLDPNVVDDQDKDSPLIKAVKGKQYDMADLILKNGALVRSFNGKGLTVLDIVNTPEMTEFKSLVMKHIDGTK